MLNDFNTALHLKYAIRLVQIMMQQSAYKVHLNTISNAELSDLLCDGVNTGLTLVRLDTHNESKCHKFAVERYSLCKTNTNSY